jgi:hypothetical protein
VALEGLAMADWKSDLGSFFEQRHNSHQESSAEANEHLGEHRQFIASVVVPAFEEVKAELEKYGESIKIYGGSESASIYVTREGDEQLRYTISVRGKIPHLETRYRDRKTGRHWISEGHFDLSLQGRTIDQFSKDDIIRNFLEDYKHHAGPLGT